MFLYHGTTKENATTIISQQKINLNLCGSQWGSTYGKGIYFSPSKTEASVYGEAIIEIETNVEPMKLQRYYSPNDRNHKRQIKKIVDTLGPDALVSYDNKEVVIFNTEDTIRNIRIV